MDVWQISGRDPCNFNFSMVLVFARWLDAQRSEAMDRKRNICGHYLRVGPQLRDQTGWCNEQGIWVFTGTDLNMAYHQQDLLLGGSQCCTHVLPQSLVLNQLQNQTSWSKQRVANDTLILDWCIRWIFTQWSGLGLEHVSNMCEVTYFSMRQPGGGQKVFYHKNTQHHVISELWTSQFQTCHYLKVVFECIFVPVRWKPLRLCLNGCWSFERHVSGRKVSDLILTSYFGISLYCHRTVEHKLEASMKVEAKSVITFHTRDCV